MRTILLATLFFPLTLLKGQTPYSDSAGSWHLLKGNTFIEYIFLPASGDSTRADSAAFADSAGLAGLILKHCKSIVGVKDVHILNGSIEFTIESHYLDYKKLGYRYVDVPVIVLHPMTWSVSIDVKKGKYRVTITNVITKMPGMYNTVSNYNWSEWPFNKQGCIREFSKNNTLLAFRIAEMDIREMFILKRHLSSNDW